MTIMIACIVAGISTAAFIALWFYEVNRELKNKKNAMESARYQLTVSRQRHLRAKDSLDIEKTQDVVVRSRDIYRQAIAQYNETFKKARNHIPGLLMGFKTIKNE